VGARRTTAQQFPEIIIIANLPELVVFRLEFVIIHSGIIAGSGTGRSTNEANGCAGFQQIVFVIFAGSGLLVVTDNFGHIHRPAQAQDTGRGVLVPGIHQILYVGIV
jgi:hypothetical protein